MKKITLVCGRLCSGKNTICQQLAAEFNAIHIITSDVVRELSGLYTREQLQQTGSMDKAIASYLIESIKQSNKPVIIDGIRQPSIIDQILTNFTEDQVDMIWIDAPNEIREQRYTSRADTKDGKSFEDADAGDISLGLDDLYSQYFYRMDIIGNY